MKYRIVRLTDLSGPETTFYSVIVEGSDKTLFEIFEDKYGEEFSDEMDEIFDRLILMADEFGARVQWFREQEGKPGDLVCALHDLEESHLRLYCIRYGSDIVILGGGGNKTTKTWQEDPILAVEVRMMMNVSEDIYRRMREGEIQRSMDLKFFEGNLNFTDDES